MNYEFMNYILIKLIAKVYLVQVKPLLLNFTYVILHRRERYNFENLFS